MARDVLVCNQENWTTACLEHFAPDVEYADGSKLAKINGKENMRTYLKNQFSFSRQWLRVKSEVCQDDTYVGAIFQTLLFVVACSKTTKILNSPFASSSPSSPSSSSPSSKR